MQEKEAVRPKTKIGTEKSLSTHDNVFSLVVLTHPVVTSLFVLLERLFWHASSVLIGVDGGSLNCKAPLTVPVENHKLAASSVTELIYRVATMDFPSVTTKFKRLGSVIPASSAHVFKLSIVASVALCRVL